MPTIMIGGVERTLLNILTELDKREYRLTLLTSQMSMDFEKQLPGRVVIRKIGTGNSTSLSKAIFSKKTRASIQSLLGLVRFMRKEKPDAVYSFQGSAISVVAQLISRAKSPLFVRESNTVSKAFIFDGSVAKKLKVLLKKMLYSKSSAIIAVSKGVADDLVVSVKIPRSKIRVIYNPTYTPQLIQGSKEPIKHKWLQAATSIPVVISVGRLSKQKDFLTLIEAFALLREKQEARLIIVGDGPERSEIERRAYALGIADNLDLIGEQSNPYKYISRADVFVLSSIFEGLPNVVIEAIGCATPVVATDCPSGPREILLDGDAGTLVPIRNPELMAHAIFNYLNDSSLANHHVQAGFDALDRFTPKRAADSYVNLIAETRHRIGR